MKMFAFCGTLLGFRSTCWEVEWMSVYQFYKLKKNPSLCLATIFTLAELLTNVFGTH